MSLRDFFYRRSEPRWLNQESPPPVYRGNSPYGGYGGNSPRGGYGGGGGDSPTTEMRVVMCCNKCEEKVREEVGEVYGVQDVLTDQARSEVVVIGFADAHDVLKKAKKVDKRADITASDSFTTHHGRHSHKHNRIHHKHSHRRSDGHGYGSGTYPIETTSSPRYNASYHQSSYGGPSRYIDHGGPGDGYRHRQYEPVLDGYRSDYQPRYQPTPMYDPEYRAEYAEYRPRYQQGYRPSQDYLPRYVDEQDYSYPEPLMNPDHIHHLDYY